MASTVLSITIIFVVALTHIAFAKEDDYSNVVANHFQRLSPRAGSRFLKDEVKKGDQCNLDKGNVCPNVAAANSTELLSCCQNRCRNILTDRNNCGTCGNKCGFGQLCCNSVCTVVAYDIKNCGTCGNVCKSGVRCEYGTCGYA